MTYDAREKSRYGGMPVECYLFTLGSTTWLYTSADREVILPSGTYAPETIERSEVEFSDEDMGKAIEVTIPPANPLAALFLGEQPTAQMWLTIFRAHRDEETDPVVLFVGKVANAKAGESEVTLACENLTGIMDRTVPTIGMQTQCNHALYSAGCGLDPLFALWRNAVSIATVEGNIVTADEFANFDDQWYRGGRLESVTGERRMIVDHQGDTVILMSPLPGLEPLQYAWAWWGCDHLEATCGEKFGNWANHLGWSRIPGKNPFLGRVD